MKGQIHINGMEKREFLLHLESEYRKANISEKDYKALREKYSNGNGKVSMTKKEEPKEEEIQEMTPEVIERLANQLSQKAAAPEQKDEKKEKKPGLFGGLFGKKKDEKPKEAQPQAAAAPVAAPEPAPVAEAAPPSDDEQESMPSMSEESKRIDGIQVETEKLKTLLETLRETGHVTDETIQTMSESIGELRSLVFQADASLKETMVKLEKIEDDIAQVKPKEIDKKFREIDADTDKKNIEMEKFRTKIEDSGDKLNKMYEMLKSIGGIENLVDINKKIQEKLKNVEEAVKYIGRIGAKTEKQFMDLSRGLEDLVIFKARQEDQDESLKEVLKSIDALNVKFESYVSKKDLEDFREEVFTIKKEVENIDKVLPMVNEKLPDDILELRKEREDINMLLVSLQEQLDTKKITKTEYTSFKEGNEKRLREIERQLDKEWKKFEKKSKPEEAQETQAISPQAQDVVKKMDEVKQAFEKETKPAEEPKKEETKAQPSQETKKPAKKKQKIKKAKPNGKLRILNDIKKMK
jgi:hypothetical protein